MAEETSPLAGLALGVAVADEPEPAEEPKRRRLRPTPTDDEREDIVDMILRRVSAAQDERADWIEKRLARYAKMRGWLERDNPPWDNASNQHIPIILANKLRTDAGLFNAVLGIRPVMKSTPTRLEHREVAERIDHLLDHQLFTDLDGEHRVEKFIDQYTGDGTVFSFQPWVRETGLVHDVRTIPRPTTTDGKVVDTETLDTLVSEQIGQFKTLDLRDSDGYEWVGTYDDADGTEHECRIDVYDLAGDDDDKIDVVFEWKTTTFDGPAMIVLDLEDIVAPMRSENLQPVSGHNPTGAPWVATLHKVDLDTVKRRQRSGVYDLLTDLDLDDLAPVAEARTDKDVSHNEDALKEQRDTKTGLQPNPGGGNDEERDWLTVVQWYGRYDLNGDGLDEDVIFSALKEPRKLARVRYLTELYPGLPPRRPFAEARFIPIPGQLYGMGLVELMEGLNDLIHDLVNSNLDNGRLANLPFGGYRASSGFKPQDHRIEPGVLLPLDNPQQDLVFPQMPNRDQTWSFNMIGLTMQFVERLVQQGALQFGQVPQGKASALRTVGTTMAILQQGAAMPEQILRRLFLGLQDVYAQFHLLNTRFLPPKKRFLVTGRPLDSEEAYGLIDDRKDIAIPIAFSFQATLLNTNKGLVAQALLSIGQALISPLVMQLGLVDPERVYNWARDLIQAQQLDPARYLKRPAGVPDLPRITAEEAILSVLEGRLPTDVVPLEPADEHLKKLLDYMQSDQFGYMTEGKNLLFNEYINRVKAIVAEQQQQQMMMQAAAQFSQVMGGEQGSAGGRPPEPGSPPPPQTEAPMMSEMMGADMSHAQ